MLHQCVGVSVALDRSCRIYRTVLYCTHPRHREYIIAELAVKWQVTYKFTWLHSTAALPIFISCLFACVSCEIGTEHLPNRRRNSDSPWRSVSHFYTPFCSLVVLWKQWVFRIANDPWRDYDSVIAWCLQSVYPCFRLVFAGLGVGGNRNESRKVPIVFSKENVQQEIRKVPVAVCYSRTQTRRMVLLFPGSRGLTHGEI